MDPVDDRSDLRSRWIPAAVADVWAAFASADRIARWWGPAGFTNTVHRYDLHPGGRWLLTMHGPDGRDYPNESVFLRVEPERVFEIEHHSGHPFVLTITLGAEDGGTRVGWRQTFPTVEHHRRIADFVAGANEENLDRLAAEVRRVVDAG